MIKKYYTDMQTNKTEQIDEYKKGCWINVVSPKEEEIVELCENLNIKEDFIRYSLDYEEKARIDIDDDETILFIVDIPILERENDIEVYTTMPIGMIVVRDDYFITVSLKENEIIHDIERNIVKHIITYKKSRLIFQILLHNSAEFLKLLKQINKETEIAEYVLKNSMKNKELLKLLSLEKSLVYFTTSLKSNEVVMEKTLRGKIIKLYKFRSMVINAEELIKSFTPEQMREYKENYKLTNDPRITKVGKFLRKTSLDELPQLINIINGDLSIIGPRPVVADELEKYGVNKDKFLSVTPGLTGYWAANGRSNTTYEQRMEMELYYIDNLSLKMDIKVFFKTILSVLKKEGAR